MMHHGLTDWDFPCATMVASSVLLLRTYYDCTVGFPQRLEVLAPPRTIER